MLFISLTIQSENFWIYPRIFTAVKTSVFDLFNFNVVGLIQTVYPREISSTVLQRLMTCLLPKHGSLSPWKWRQQCPLKRWYPTSRHRKPVRESSSPWKPQPSPTEVSRIHVGATHVISRKTRKMGWGSDFSD